MGAKAELEIVIKDTGADVGQPSVSSPPGVSADMDAIPRDDHQFVVQAPVPGSSTNEFVLKEAPPRPVMAETPAIPKSDADAPTLLKTGLADSMGAPIPVFVVNEVPVRVLGGLEGIGAAKADVDEDGEPYDDVQATDDNDPSQELLSLLRPLTFGGAGPRVGGALGDVQGMLGGVRNAALKFTGPAFGSMLSSAGGGLTTAAASSGGGAVAGVMGGAGGLLSGAGGLVAAAGPAGIALAGLAATAGLAVAAVGKYTDVLMRSAESLEHSSPELQVAFDMERLRDEMNQLRRGARFGEQLSGFVETKGEFDRAMLAIWDEVLQALLDLWTDLEPLARESVEWLKAIASVQGPLEMMRALLTPAWLGMAKDIAAMSADTRKVLNLEETGKEWEVEDDPLARNFIDFALRTAAAPVGAPLAAPMVPAPPLGI